MAVEIERKFLVARDDFPDGPSVLIRQAYLTREPGRTVRVRVFDEEGWLTVKGERVGASRPEFEYSIPLGDARQLIDLCLPFAVEKRRFLVSHGNHVWHVDQFLGKNSGLLLAEIELQSEEEVFQMPEWIGREVTGDERYLNSYLSIYPFQSWSSSEDSLADD
ncbi:MAG: CYTH domain-containing protein [Mariniblastus sp.]|nr:CYTH domain-containing protein [Mariniblastus sp.]